MSKENLKYVVSSFRLVAQKKPKIGGKLNMGGAFQIYPCKKPHHLFSDEMKSDVSGGVQVNPLNPRILENTVASPGNAVSTEL